eukprot:COSAG05_NODE_16892_length_336_cov_1.075949_1_plen_39_part_10
MQQSVGRCLLRRVIRAFSHAIARLSEFSYNYSQMDDHFQ